MRSIAKGLATGALLACVVVSVQAKDLGPAASPRNSGAAFAPTAGEASTPVGWKGFCRDHAGDCDVAALKAVDVALTPLVRRTLQAVNARVNRTVAPITDEDHWGVAERWSYPDDGKGDCEDYALQKRKLLMGLGLPRQALLMTVVRDNRGDGHAVLTVVTNKGDLILDNKRDHILTWNRTGYGFIKRQSQSHPSRWVMIGEPASATATATAQ